MLSSLRVKGRRFDPSTILAPFTQLDGFRMQLTHSTRPFVAKMRMAPGAGSRPERILVDLGKIKKLASLLEEQAEHLAQLPGDDNAMEAPTEPKDRGSLAVEARAKHLAEMLDNEFPDGEEEKMSAKKVRFCGIRLRPIRLMYSPSVERRSLRLVSCIRPLCLQLLLLLRRNNRLP